MAIDPATLMMLLQVAGPLIAGGGKGGSGGSITPPDLRSTFQGPAQDPFSMPRVSPSGVPAVSGIPQTPIGVIPFNPAARFAPTMVPGASGNLINQQLTDAKGLQGLLSNAGPDPILQPQGDVLINKEAVSQAKGKIPQNGSQGASKGGKTDLLKKIGTGVLDNAPNILALAQLLQKPQTVITPANINSTFTPSGINPFVIAQQLARARRRGK